MQKIANFLGVGKDNVFASSGDNGYGRLEILKKFDQFLNVEEEIEDNNE